MRLALISTLLASSAALAQYTPYTNTLNGRQFATMSGAYGSFITTQLSMRDSVRASMRASLNKAPAAAPQAPPPAFKFALTVSDFKPAAARNTAEQFAAVAKTPEERAQSADLARTIIQTIEAQPGVRKHNLSTALTVLFGAALQILAEREFSDAESEGLQRLMNDALAETPAFKTMTAAKRTALYDACLITGGLMAGIASNANESGNAEEKALAKQMAKDTLALFGIK